MAEINRDFLTCYILRHSWDEYQDNDWNVTAESLIDQPVSFRCVRCGTVRRELWNRNSGKVESRSYMYPDGYSVEKLELDLGMSRTEHFRVEYVEVNHPIIRRRKVRR